MGSLEIGVAIAAFFLHLFSFTFNYLLYLTAKRKRDQMVTNRYILVMCFAEVSLNFTQIICVDFSLWISSLGSGFQSYNFFLDSVAAYFVVTLNQIFFLFRYYLLVLIVIHRAIIIMTPKISHFFEAHVSHFIIVCWTYVIFINVAYFPLGCIRFYDAKNHAWKTECLDDSLLLLVILREVSSLAYSYIPHFTIAVNLAIIIYLKHYRSTRKVTTTQEKNSGKYEYSMILQPLMLAAVLTIEPLCFFIAGVISRIMYIPPLSDNLFRIFNYSMTYVSIFTNFIFYFVFHRDIRRLMLNLRKTKKDNAPLNISRSATTDILARVG